MQALSAALPCRGLYLPAWALQLEEQGILRFLSALLSLSSLWWSLLQHPEKPGGWLWSAASTARILSFFLCFCLQPPSFPAVGPTYLFLSGETSIKGKEEKGDQEVCYLQGCDP